MPRMIFSFCLCVITVSTLFLPATSRDTDFDVQPFRVNLAHEVPHMKALIQNTRLPGTTLYPAADIEFGIRLDFLRDLQMKWLNDFDWTKQEAALNKVPHFTAKIEGLTVHFVHARSKEPDRIPLLMMHGWPGSFQEFLPVIKPLTKLWKSPTGKRISFDVIVPSLPGFLFSSPPPQNWTTNDTARIFNTLMVNVLGYSTYALHGTDRGSVIGYTLYSAFNTSVRAANLKSIPFVAPTPDDIAANNITLSDIAKVTEQRTADNRATGQGYFTEQTFKPNTIGLALYDNPIGQLAWIGGNIQLWSDPRAGTPPSVLTDETLLTMVSLYYLTQTFQSSVWLYAQNPNTFSPNYLKPATDAPLVFSLFEFDIMLWPREYVERASNLVLYKGPSLTSGQEHDFGGHFAGLDNPPALIEDLHDLGVYFEP
ncbi:Alpha/Beta hydrolase protein [Mycena albidolilacea]|uniref:Alpha/Beta hydrolase protein n=1 Tax=Mycena albidolilacea TaxID=1033008 RepID=A0AAD7AFS6_9AGAR|nr:Alpha/Beta hydrolase protein [Mycena albidolilacea]